MTKQTECRASDPSKCRYHRSQTDKLKDGILSLLAGDRKLDKIAANAEEEIKDQVAAVIDARKRARKESIKDLFRPGATTWPMMAESPVEDCRDKPFLETEKYRNVKKMPALFVIDRTIHMATDAVNEKGAWVFEEPSRVTIKRDGTGVTVTEDGKVYARRTVKKGRPVPPGFLLAELDTFTGHQFGLEPVEQSGFHKMFKEAAEDFDGPIPPGTYELCGPKLAGNPERLEKHRLMPHGTEEAVEIPDMREIPREEAYERLKTIFEDYKRRGIEGVVWWGADGKRTKLRVYDYWGDPNRR